MFKRRIESLLSLSMYSFLNNLPKYSQVDDVQALPTYIKNKILKKFTSSLRYSHGIDFRVVFEALVNQQTTHINLYANIDDCVLHKIKVCRNLKKLYLNNIAPGCVTTSGLINLLTCLQKLQYLEIRQCDEVTDDVLKCISENCRELQGISVAGCKNISDDGLKYLARLETLLGIDLIETEITDAGVCALAHGKSAKNLKELKIKCSNVTDSSLKLICSSCPNIELLTFYNNKHGDYLSPIETFDDYPLKNLKQLTFVVQW